jgi:hypothetical protein
MKRLEGGVLREIDNPNNSKRDDDRGDAEAEYKPDVMPRHALSSLPRWNYRALFRTLGRTHDVLLMMRPGPLPFSKSCVAQP